MGHSTDRNKTTAQKIKPVSTLRGGNFFMINVYVLRARYCITCVKTSAKHNKSKKPKEDYEKMFKNFANTQKA